jgi:hypothetical protein
VQTSTCMRTRHTERAAELETFRLFALHSHGCCNSAAATRLVHETRALAQVRKLARFEMWTVLVHAKREVSGHRAMLY